MSSEKKPGDVPPLTPSDLCERCVSSGMRAPCRARFGDPPRWCANHDPDQADRRRQAGAKRRPRFGGRGVDPRTLPTVDYIVDYAIDLAEQVARGDIEAPQGRAAAQLLKAAVDGLKARGSVGDLQPAKKDAPAASQEAPTGTLDDLEEGLDS